MTCSQNISNICLECSENYSKIIRTNGIFCDLCEEEGLFVNQTDFCLNCNENCVSCFNETFCKECQQNYYLSPLYTCVESCPDDYYADSYLKKCELCDVSCKKCYGPLFNQCIYCNEPFSQYGDSCIMQCPQNMTNFNYTCQSKRISFFTNKIFNFLKM